MTTGIIGDYTGFLEGILSRVTTEGFDLADLAQLDHTVTEQLQVSC